MSTTLTIRDVPITFPFTPYDIQKEYMAKVIECLQNETNGVLESPTGTGKTLSLLCSSLAWLTMKKAQMQVDKYKPFFEDASDSFFNEVKKDLEKKVGNLKNDNKAFYGVPTIIYSSRTHTQLSQAMQELKRTAYNHLKATVVGSRDQLCINREVMNEENNSAKIHMCRLKVHTKSCFFYNKVERFKDDPRIDNINVLDIEDLVTIGEKNKFCPYFMAKEMQRKADIIFMPYNYILDIRSRKALGIELSNTVVILDEAHNVDKMCEESASVELKSSDITLCIEEVTGVMKAMTIEPSSFDTEDTPKDFTADELCVLKQIFLDFEKAVDDVEFKSQDESTFEGDYIYEIFKKAGVQYENSQLVEVLIDKILTFLSTAVPDGPFQRKGTGLEVFESLLKIVFANPSPEYIEKIKKCYKVHVKIEEIKKTRTGSDWLSKATAKQNGRVLSFWCFSSGFGMNMMMAMGIKCVILTSGTLAPLKPLISELQLDVPVRLENPHIVTTRQICVKILTKGPDGTELNSSFQNRNNPQYISSLGRTILNLTRIIPNGMLIFFPSYPIMQKCQQEWEGIGIWNQICDQKAIYVEPKQKGAFDTAMKEYYNRVNSTEYKGAIFMGVCRGKISEGLDFADNNGRAVLITGLPYPPLKDPKIVLKRNYMDQCQRQDKEFLNGNEWYSLEASRAVNQAMGRIIRHKNDYGSIILLDTRFTGYNIKSQLSKWLRDHIRVTTGFGEIIRDLRNFYRNAEVEFPFTKKAPSVIAPPAASFDTSDVVLLKNKSSNFNFKTSASTSTLNNPGSSGVNKLLSAGNQKKRKRITMVYENRSTTATTPEVDIKDFIVMVKDVLNQDDFKAFLEALTFYRDTGNFDEFTSKLDAIFMHKYNLQYVIYGLLPYIKNVHKEKFQEYFRKFT